MGRGLVEPVDQMHDANPASHPALLQRLADDFADSGFDLRRLMSGILHSDAYLRSTRWTSGGERTKESDYAAAVMKPLTPDQLTTSIGLATGHFEQLRAKFERDKANRKIDNLTPAIARALYWRERDVQEFANRFRTGGEGFEANAGQALFEPRGVSQPRAGESATSCTRRGSLRGSRKHWSRGRPAWARPRGG
jgi:hypothetical protein